MLPLSLYTSSSLPKKRNLLSIYLLKHHLPLLFLPLRSFWKGWSTLDLEASQVALVIKNAPANAGDVRDVHLIPELGRSPGGEHGNPLHGEYSMEYSPPGEYWTEEPGRL